MSKSNIISFKRKENSLSLDQIAAQIRIAGSTEGIDLRGLTLGQRAMIGARLVTATGPRGPHQPADAINTQMAGRLVGLQGQYVSYARRIRQGATPKEIQRIETGSPGIERLSQQLRLGLTPAQRIAAAAVPITQRGDYPESIHRQRLAAEIWRCLRQGLLGLTGLPAPRDVAQLLRGRYQQAILIDATLLRAQNWLEEFIDEWTRPEKQ